MSREADLYKDRIEVSLDGRQIFYLFFGGAVIVGLVFVLGVMVGRRVEARGHVDRARTTAAVDPLAALDRLEDKGGLSFKGALMGNPAPSDVENAIGEIEKARAAKPEKTEHKVEHKPEHKPEQKVEAPKPEPKKAEEPKKVEEAKKADEPKKEAKVEAKVEPKVEKKKVDEPKRDEPKKPADEAKKPTDEAKKPADEAKKADAVADKPKPEEPKKADEEKKAKYTLQLSSFQDKAEADAFLSAMKSQGYSAHVTEATVAGKGTFYRVRMGSYKSIEAANDAKAEFEKTAKKSASVMKL